MSRFQRTGGAITLLELDGGVRDAKLLKKVLSDALRKAVVDCSTRAGRDERLAPP
ncbi:MAG: hypothetical protein WC807_17845 [Hyphomicrobium sp.]|jgi:hypothetical protein